MPRSLIKLLCIFILSFPVLAQEDKSEGVCNCKSSQLDVYGKSIQEFSELLVLTGKIEKGDIQTLFVEGKEVLFNSDKAVSFFNKEFNTTLFDNACFVRSQIFSFKYKDSSVTEFGAHNFTFSNPKDIEKIIKVLEHVRRKHFQTRKIRTTFDWVQEEYSLLVFHRNMVIPQRRTN